MDHKNYPDIHALVQVPHNNILLVLDVRYKGKGRTQLIDTTLPKIHTIYSALGHLDFCPLIEARQAKERRTLITCPEMLEIFLTF